MNWKIIRFDNYWWINFVQTCVFIKILINKLITLFRISDWNSLNPIENIRFQSVLRGGERWPLSHSRGPNGAASLALMCYENSFRLPLKEFSKQGKLKSSALLSQLSQINSFAFRTYTNRFQYIISHKIYAEKLSWRWCETLVSMGETDATFFLWYAAGTSAPHKNLLFFRKRASP